MNGDFRMRWLTLLMIGVVGLETAARGQLRRPGELDYHTGWKRVEAQLIADTSAVTGGKAFEVAVVFTIAPEQHLYWKNPGDAGQAVKVDLVVPEGFTVSEVRYPVPQKFMQPGDLIAYGYEGKVVLAMTVTPPAKVQGSTVEMEAKARWLVCDADKCVPGKEVLALSLPVGEGKKVNGEIFGQWEGKFPARERDADSPATVLASATAMGSKDGYACTIELKWKRPVTDVEFFPGKSSALKIQNVTVTNKGSTSEVRFTAEVMKGQTLDVNSLENVVAYTDKDGKRRGVEVNVELVGNKK